jgi:hypothetical protein
MLGTSTTRLSHGHPAPLSSFGSLPSGVRGAWAALAAVGLTLALAPVTGVCGEPPDAVEVYCPHWPDEQPPDLPNPNGVYRRYVGANDRPSWLYERDDSCSLYYRQQEGEYWVVRWHNDVGGGTTYHRTPTATATNVMPWECGDWQYLNWDPFVWYEGAPVFVPWPWTWGGMLPLFSPQNWLAGTTEPINTMDGNVYFTETDVAIPCPGPALEFRRRYNSAQPQAGVLGQGWVHSYNWRLSETNMVFGVMTNTWKVVLTDEGTPVYFLKTWTNTYVSSLDLNWSLRAVTNDRTELRLPDGTIYTFDTNGVLLTVGDVWSNAVSMTYTNAYPSNLLTRAEHTCGLSLDFSYTFLTRLRHRNRFHLFRLCWENRFYRSLPAVSGSEIAS